MVGMAGANIGSGLVGGVGNIAAGAGQVIHGFDRPFVEFGTTINMGTRKDPQWVSIHLAPSLLTLVGIFGLRGLIGTTQKAKTFFSSNNSDYAGNHLLDAIQSASNWSKDWTPPIQGRTATDALYSLLGK